MHTKSAGTLRGMQPLAQSLYDLTPTQLATQFKEWGEPAFRVKQVLRWLYQSCVAQIDEMSDLPKGLRQRLQDAFVLGRYTATAEQTSTDGWTRKWLLRSPDGQQIETVLMEYDGQRRTACISSQAGCAMNCSFCATGQMGFMRNLRAGEIIEQVIWVERALRNAGKVEADARLTNVVLMGMGEPFANYPHVMESVHRLTLDEASGGLGMGTRRITVSTVGLVPGIRKFATETGQVNLAVSLHAATDELRDKLVPINIRYPLHELSLAIRDYLNKTNRRVSIEWALIDGVNDTREQALALVDFVRDTFDPAKERRHLLHVNMIPLNPTGGFRGRASNLNGVDGFRAALDRANIPNTVRVRRGIDIAAGCGQLRERAGKAG
jgi:23S rRNA (adenine2503-C2)-methyltransferase